MAEHTRRVNVLHDLAAYQYPDGFVSMVERAEPNGTNAETAGEGCGAWKNPETDAPAFVRRALGIRYVHEQDEPFFRPMRIVDWYRRGKTGRA